MRFIREYKIIFLILFIIFYIIFISYRLTFKSEIPKEEYQEHVEEAYYSLQRRDYSAFISALKKTVSSKPDDYNSTSALAHLLYQYGDYEGARKYFQQILQYHGHLKTRGIAETYYYLGMIAVKENNKTKAIKYFEKAIEIEPEYGEAYAGLALCHEGETKIEIYRKGIENASWDVENYIGLLTYYKDNGYDLSTISFEELQDLIPLEGANSLVLSKIGHIFYEYSNKDVAMIIHEKALEKNETLEMSHRELGSIYEEKGLYEKAEKSYKQAIEYDQEVLNFINLARLYYKLGKYKETVETLRECIYYEDFDSNNEGIYLLARAYYKLGDYENALYWLKRCDADNDDIVEFRKRLQQKIKEQEE
ncbi:hypothetical protein BBF96_12180 [Anoxybacter fermentans]|uniref:Uncharacterized protein n=1 Tax=Anoxybacter fermentans TaxID=1323375 RepID=A0A3S9T0Q6_9FIRM|nr:tetratricopeptide repeat protein [Anoxybacter fermentans]AZR74087.1 hypothetical protein BBF96_12180 [Anoxybacter fermentans]